MKKIKVTLKASSNLKFCAFGIRTCHQSYDKGDNGGDRDLDLIARVGNKLKHKSVLEHISYTFFIQGISRACLQELARHRMASLSVKSSRYTLKELKNEAPFLQWVANRKKRDTKRIYKYIVETPSGDVNILNAETLERLRHQMCNGEVKKLDYLKYLMPEAYRTSLVWTINARSLQNFLELRSSKAALWEIQHLAQLIYKAIPQKHKFIFAEYFAD